MPLAGTPREGFWAAGRELVGADGVAEDALERALPEHEVRALYGCAEGGDLSLEGCEVERRAAHDERQVRRLERVGQGRAGVRRME